LKKQSHRAVARRLCFSTSRPIENGGSRLKATVTVNSDGCRYSALIFLCGPHCYVMVLFPLLSFYCSNTAGTQSPGVHLAVRVPSFPCAAPDNTDPHLFFAPLAPDSARPSSPLLRPSKRGRAPCHRPFPSDPRPKIPFLRAPAPPLCHHGCGGGGYEPRGRRRRRG
jgi:hypothetical protein